MLAAFFAAPIFVTLHVMGLAQLLLSPPSLKESPVTG
jgi:hypothetical protein